LLDPVLDEGKMRGVEQTSIAAAESSVDWTNKALAAL
jgi:hypothetical protein